MTRCITPTSNSWLYTADNFVSSLTRQRLQRGVFHPIVVLQTAIKSYIEEHSRHPKPFRWTKTADEIKKKSIA